MSLHVWTKETIKVLNQEQATLWVDYVSLFEPSKTDNEILNALYQLTRTPRYQTVFLWISDNQIHCSCNVVMNGRVLSLEDLIKQPSSTDTELKEFLQAVLRYLKEEDHVQLHTFVDAHHDYLLKILSHVGFVVYDQTDEKMKLNYQIVERVRYPFEYYSGPVHIGLFQLLLGIPFHKDFNNRFYKQILRHQVSNWFILYLFIIPFSLVYILYNEVQSNPVILLLCIVWGFWIVYNLMNGVRYIKLRRHASFETTKYLKAVRVYTLFTFVFIIISSLITLSLYWFLY